MKQGKARKNAVSCNEKCRIGVVGMQIAEQRIAEIFDFSRFEPSKTMEKIVSAFAEKYKVNQKNSRERVSFDELLDNKSAKTEKQPNHDNLSKSSEKKNDKSM